MCHEAQFRRKPHAQPVDRHFAAFARRGICSRPRTQKRQHTVPDWSDLRCERAEMYGEVQQRILNPLYRASVSPNRDDAATSVRYNPGAVHSEQAGGSTATASPNDVRYDGAEITARPAVVPPAEDSGPAHPRRHDARAIATVAAGVTPGLALRDLAVCLPGLSRRTVGRLPRALARVQLSSTPAVASRTCCISQRTEHRAGSGQSEQR
jgi:hypothetical protein